MILNNINSVQHLKMNTEQEHCSTFQLKSSNGNTYVELKCSDAEDEEEVVELSNNNKINKSAKAAHEINYR